MSFSFDEVFLSSVSPSTSTDYMSLCLSSAYQSSYPQFAGMFGGKSGYMTGKSGYFTEKSSAA
jgi:hypothetical protein